MKTTKKLFALALALVMVFALTATAFADSTYTITIGGAVAGETYTAYKIFDATISGSNVSYTIDNTTTNPIFTALTTADADFGYTVSRDTTTNVITTSWFVFTPTPTKDSTVYHVQAATGHLDTDAPTGTNTDADVVKLAGLLNKNKTSFTAAGSVTGGATTTISNLSAGYYFVDTSLGSICSLDTVHDVTINEKNAAPSSTKQASENGSDWGSDATVKIGDTVYFKIVITDGTGTDAAITLHDVMETGLTLNIGSFTIVDDDDDTSDSDVAYTIKYNHEKPVKGTAGTNVVADNASGQTAITDGDTFEIVFTESYISKLASGKKITVTYQAELNKDAEIMTNTNDNSSHITYQSQTGTTTTVEVKTYEADIVKTDNSGNLLNGATFKLYNAATGGTEYELIQISNGIYEIKSSDNGGIIASKLEPVNGVLTIRGLENGTYYIEEVDNPAGYNPLAKREGFTIANGNAKATLSDSDSDGTDDTWTSGGLRVINHQGTELPSTGGIGTTIFYVVGGLLVAAAGVLLITRRRMRDQEN